MATFQRQSANYVEIAGGFCSASIALQPSSGEEFSSKYVEIAGAGYGATP
jgi:hypothetical protein